jgi:hypothetical protein
MDLLDSIKDALGKDDAPEEFVEETLGEEEELSQKAAPRGEEKGDYLETVESSLGGLESVARKIPGYGGYKEKELRREADKLLRIELAGRFDDQRKRVSELQHQLISQAKIEFLDDLERAVMKLQLLIDRIKTASYGYAGLFDAVKVKEEQLDALYAFDNQMLDFVDEVAADMDQVTSAIAAGEGIGDAIGALVGTVGEANQAFGHREEAILQAGML